VAGEVWEAPSADNLGRRFSLSLFLLDGAGSAGPSFQKLLHYLGTPIAGHVPGTECIGPLLPPLE
jgi:hypothetical protein